MAAALCLHRARRCQHLAPSLLQQPPTQFQRCLHGDTSHGGGLLLHSESLWASADSAAPPPSAAVAAQAAPPHRNVVAVHGLLGSGRNLRVFMRDLIQQVRVCVSCEGLQTTMALTLLHE